MGSLSTMIIGDFKGDEWKMTKGTPVILECLKDSSMIEFIDIDYKLHKMTFQQGGKIFIDKIEDKYRLHWNDDDLI